LTNIEISGLGSNPTYTKTDETYSYIEPKIQEGFIENSKVTVNGYAVMLITRAACTFFNNWFSILLKVKKGKM